MLAKKNKKNELTGMQWVRKLREQKGMTSYGLAKLLGTTYQRIERLEDAFGCRMDILVRLRRFFGLSWSELGALIEEEVGDTPTLETRPYKPQKKRKKKLE